MPIINSSMVPTISPGNLFRQFTTNTSLEIRWLTALDPVFYESQNRVSADIALRQLVMAKTVDQMSVRLGHQMLYPFLIQPKVESGTAGMVADVPLTWIWDMSVSLNKRWRHVRLGKIKRVSENTLRLVFMAESDTGTVGEQALFQVDTEINSDLTYQYVRIEAPTGPEAADLSAGEENTFAGFVIFKTLDQDDPIVESFLDIVASGGGSVDSGGEFVDPAVYEIQDTDAGTSVNLNDFNSSPMSHGTGLLLVSATSPLLDTSTIAETDPVYNAEKGQPNGAATLDGTGNVPISQLGNVSVSETDPVYNAEKGQPNGAATLDGTGDVPASQLGNVHSNANDPTAAEKAALAGTFGSPSGANRYVTDTDPRFDSLSQGIVTGTLTVQSPLTLGVRTSGLVLAKDGLQVAVSDQDVNFAASDPTNPRVDLIQWNGSALSVKQGTAAASPACEAPDSGNIPVCVVFIPATATNTYDLDNQGATTDSVIIAYYFQHTGLYARRVGVTSSPATSSASFIDANEMFIPVYLPRTGIYEMTFETHLRSSASLTPVRGEVNINLSGVDQTSDLIGSLIFIPFSSLSDQAEIARSSLVRIRSAGSEKITGRWRSVDSPNSIDLYQRRRSIIVREVR